MAITWRNVDAPDFRGVGQLLQTSSNFLDKGAEQLNAVLQERVQAQQKAWDKGEEANTLQAVNQIRQMQNLDDVKNADLNALTQPYGAQINAAAVLDSLAKQSGVIAQNKQTEATVRDLNDQDKYGGIYAQARQALANGDLKTGEQLAAQLGGSKFGQAIAEDIAAAKAQSFSQWEARQRLANDNARLAIERTQIDKENNLNAQKNAVAGIIETARVKGEDPAPAIAQYLGGLNDRSNNPTLSAFANSEIGRIYTLSGKQKQEYDQALASLTAARDNIKTKANEAVQQVMQSTGLSPTYLGNVGKVGSPNDVNTYVGNKENQIPADVYNEVNANLRAQGEGDINIGSELPDLISQYDPSTFTLDSTNAENLATYLRKQRAALRIYKEKTSDIAKQVNILNNDFNKRIAEWDGNIKRAYAANDQARIGLYQVQAENVKPGTVTIPVDTPTTLAKKAQAKAEAERDAANKRADYEHNLAVQSVMPTPQSRAVSDIVDATNNIKAPVGYKPEAALSNLLDFSNAKENAALYDKWKAQAKNPRSLTEWRQYQAAHQKQLSSSKK